MAARRVRSYKKTRANPLRSKRASSSEKRFNGKDLISPETQWDAYQAIEGQIYAAWKNLQQDVARGAPHSVLLEDRNRLMLLLGECNYLAREWMSWTEYPKKASKRWK